MLIKAYAFEDLTREQFLLGNRLVLEAQIVWTNWWLSETYGSSALYITEANVWVPFFLEVFVSEGKVDLFHPIVNFIPSLAVNPEDFPNFHQDDAPWNWDMRFVGTNIAAFVVYMGQLKNKPIRRSGNFSLFDDIFRIGTINESDQIATRILAGIVAGVFEPESYVGRRVPKFELIESFIHDRPLKDVLSKTGFQKKDQRSLDQWISEMENAFSLVEREKRAPDI